MFVHRLALHAQCVLLEPLLYAATADANDASVEPMPAPTLAEHCACAGVADDVAQELVELVVRVAHEQQRWRRREREAARVSASPHVLIREQQLNDSHSYTWAELRRGLSGL